ncbi:MAG TPA: cupredoxin domain-containing protein [Dehalococcoidia bacterium]|nr:cupredoxin domain-containing protein [Dehalococcoidia bacterium]
MHRFKVLLGSFGIALALVAVGLGPDSAVIRSEAGHASTSIVAIETGDNYFSPLQITVSAGDTVVWTNIGADSHTITSGDGSWGTDDIEPGATYSYTFTQPGTYPYVCLIHINHHQGTITVQ